MYVRDFKALIRIPFVDFEVPCHVHLSYLNQLRRHSELIVLKFNCATVHGVVRQGKQQSIFLFTNIEKYLKSFHQNVRQLTY